MSRTLVLADPAADLEPLARRGHWRLTGRAAAGHHDHAHRTWATPDGTTVRRIDHHGNGAAVVAVTGDGDGDVEGVADAVADAVDVLTVDDIVDELSSPETTAVGLIRALRRLELAHLGDYSDPPPLDPRYPSLVAALAANPDRGVRLTTMLVADELATIWPDLRAPIRARHGVETDLAYIVEAFLVED